MNALARQMKALANRFGVSVVVTQPSVGNVQVENPIHAPPAPCAHTCIADSHAFARPHAHNAQLVLPTPTGGIGVQRIVPGRWQPVAAWKLSAWCKSSVGIVPGATCPGASNHRSALLLDQKQFGAASRAIKLATPKNQSLATWFKIFIGNFPHLVTHETYKVHSANKVASSYLHMQLYSPYSHDDAGCMQARAVLGEGWVGQPHMRVEVARRRQAGSLRHVALAASQLHACGREGLLDLAAAQAEVPPPQGAPAPDRPAVPRR